MQSHTRPAEAHAQYFTLPPFVLAPVHRYPSFQALLAFNTGLSHSGKLSNAAWR